ncbi:gamma-interferon-inducible lysosomal thiol reductase-like isoform X2 [Pectinophora gossypiella]|uniref:gamma-interferon-inducible lysosomal thiol reductase-like isoform X2 n=1 Tax=Pectinophora gossypiella TaxID=13191 RepID=UPI00214F0CBC|nr:gamma-interferon-inducible lysosomal thiol reductase-like isoform X2 [Pectinophora gossypiella]XP_049879257.1 gamma-interferon-inducible lysosomal thiol reductase-like isoform X2 [Pectinophora gossypiella]
MEFHSIFLPRWEIGMSLLIMEVAPLNGNHAKHNATGLVKVDLYYESRCSDSIAEYPEMSTVVKKLHNYINLTTYPYGKAKMREENGKVIFTCQHGEKECYGNKLHACAIDQLKDVRKYVDFNGCLMTRQSNDAAVDECGKLQKVDSEAIKNCARGPKGDELLIHYGKESEKIKYTDVPWVLINGELKANNTSLLDTVCKAIGNPPKECQK